MKMWPYTHASYSHPPIANETVGRFFNATDYTSIYFLHNNIPHNVWASRSSVLDTSNSFGLQATKKMEDYTITPSQWVGMLGVYIGISVLSMIFICSSKNEL